MRTQEIRFMQRGVGDCPMAKGHETYGLFFESNVELRKLVNDIYGAFKDNMKVRPNVILTGRDTKRTMGTAAPHSGRIRLHNKGANVGCLLHEIGHLFKNTNNHGHWFKNAQTHLLVWWNKNRETYIDKTTKVGTTWKPTITAAAALGKNGLKHGDRVYWINKKFGRVEGTIARVNPKSMTIKDHDVKFLSPSTYFRVTPGLLKKVNATAEGIVIKPKVDSKPVKIKTPKDNIAKILADAKKVEEEAVEDTDEEINDLISGLMDGMEKYAVNGTLSMSGIVKCMWVNGVKNTDKHRKIALDYVRNDLGITIR